MAGFGFFGLQSRSGHVEGSSQLAYSWGFLSLLETGTIGNVVWAMKIGAWLVVFHRGLYYCTTFIGITINHYKDPYKIKSQEFFLGFRWVPFWTCWELWWFLGQFFLLIDVYVQFFLRSLWVQPSYMNPPWNDSEKEEPVSVSFLAQESSWSYLIWNSFFRQSTLSPIIMEVENYREWKESNIGRTHFPLSWLWEEGQKLCRFHFWGLDILRLQHKTGISFSIFQVGPPNSSEKGWCDGGKPIELEGVLRNIGWAFVRL